MNGKKFWKKFLIGVIPMTKKRFTFTLDVYVVKNAKKKAIDDDESLSGLVEKLLRRYAEPSEKVKGESDE